MKTVMSKWNHAAVVAAALTAVSCGVHSKAKVNSDESVKATRLSVSSIDKIGVNLLQKLDANSDGNRFISPLSIQTALSMLAEGAASTTLSEIETLLGGSISDINASNVALTDAMLGSSDYTLEVGNALWFGKNFTPKPKFQQLLNRHYQATAQNVDFADAGTVNTLNQWASEKTHGMIPTIATQLDPQTRLMITNATYFEGEWRTRFYGANEDDFTLSNGQKIPVKYLGSMLPQNYLRGADYQATARRYGKNGDAAMVIIRPDASLASFQAKLTPEALKSIVDSTLVAPAKLLQFAMPKISFEYGADLTPSLKALGVSSIFSGADLSNMSDEKGLEVGSVAHKANIKVDEKGTKAAAVTSISVVAAGGPHPEATMIVDKPYLFAIVEAKTGAVIFLGSVEKPVNQ